MENGSVVPSLEDSKWSLAGRLGAGAQSFPRRSSSSNFSGNLKAPAFQRLPSPASEI